MRAKPRILIVDDDPVIRRLLQVSFRLEAFEVETSAMGGETIEKAQTGRPDAIVVDVMMPGMDGWEVCRRLKEDESLSGIPVVFLSARSDDDERERGEAAGIADYVAKPFDPGELVQVVRRAMAAG